MAAPEGAAPIPDRLDELLALRERLTRDSKLAKSKKDTGEAAVQPLDYSSALSLILPFASSISTSVSSSVNKGTSTGTPVPTTAAFEALDLVLRRALSVLSPSPSSSSSSPSFFASELPSARSTLSQSFLLGLSSTLYTTWETHLTSAQQKLRSSLQLVLQLAGPEVLGFPKVAEGIKARCLVDRWDSKRTLSAWEAVLPYGRVEEFAKFAVGAEGEVEEGVVRRFVNAMVDNEEMSQLLGKVVLVWVEKVWGEKGYVKGKELGEAKEQHGFWIRPALQACRTGGQKARNSMTPYLIQPVLGKRKDGFKVLLQEAGFSFEQGQKVWEEMDEEELETALALLKAGNALGLVELDASSPSSSADKFAAFRIALPMTLLSTCLSHLSTSLRTSALSLLVLSPSTSTPFPMSSFSLLASFYAHSLGEEDPEFRMFTTSLTGKLLLRLRDSAWKASRTAKKGKDGAAAAEEYVDAVQQWMERFLDLVGRENLNPAKPYRIKINSLRMLDLAFQARVDGRYQLEGATVAAGAVGAEGPGASSSAKNTTTGYSTYRKTAQTQTPMFQAKHKKLEKGSEHLAAASSSAPSTAPSSASTSPSPSPVPSSPAPTDESGWPFLISLATPATTQILLQQLLSTYTALRFLALSILEHFPAPLPGYEGPSGAEKAKTELLLPALRMIRSGREAEASAGAGVMGLLWRKWVLESVEKGGEEAEEGRWLLGEVGGWQEGAETKTGPAGFAFISSLLDLTTQQLSHYSSNLAEAAGAAPMHGTLLALRHLFISIPVSSNDTLSTPDERRALFHRALGVIRQVWEVTSPVLAARAPEGTEGEEAEEGEADTEEARAIRFERKKKQEDDEEREEILAEGSGGPQHKIILSACWRAMKENSELLETILRLPSELGTSSFRHIWHYEEIREIGDLFSVWLARIRHRGAHMACHPCYRRAAAALLVAGKEWEEVGKLPEEWLDNHLDAIVSKRISFTRRSAGIPYLILGLLLEILPSSRSAFDRAFTRLFEIAESTSSEISDESRTHAMNTIRTVFLDAKGGVAAAQYIERGFLVAISLFFSHNWILRNVAMMLFASLTTRALNARRTNLDRDPASLSRRLSMDEFFGRYPALHAVLREQLERGWKESLEDTPSSNLHSSLFAILMLLSLLQTPKRIVSSAASTGASLAAPFIPLVKACAASKVWKIREGAGDALTGLVAVDEVARVAAGILRSVKEEEGKLSHNELHGRLVQVQSLLEGAEVLTGDEAEQVSTAYLALLPTSLPPSSGSSAIRPQHPFAVLAAYLSISLHLPSTCSLTASESPATLAATYLASSATWDRSALHLPTAEDFLKVCWAVVFGACGELEDTEAKWEKLFLATFAGKSLEAKRVALEVASSVDVGGLSPFSTPAVSAALLGLVLSASEAGDVRVTAANLLRSPSFSYSGATRGKFDALSEVYETTDIVPLREAVLPVLTGAVEGDEQREGALRLIEDASTADQPVEAREAAGLALISLSRTFGTSSISSLSPAQKASFCLATLRMLQDDDITVRSYAHKAYGLKVVEGRAVEVVLQDGGGELLERVLEEQEDDLKSDLDLLSNPSSLLFTVEKPNIYVDPLLVPSRLPSAKLEDGKKDQLEKLEEAVRQGKALEAGPLGRGGNESLAKWEGVLGVRA
ncbi:hypothetical protein JCM8547_003140 [Rhodosporidiobolus lusitaniae]